MKDLQYKRNLRNTFAIKKNIVEEQIENYFSKIVIQNTIEGLIKPSVFSVNGLYEIHYDITGMQSMDIIFQTKEIDFDELQKLFFCLELLLRETEKYLLDTSHFVFEPEQLFYSFDTRLWSFLYDFSAQEHTLYPLAEYLMERCNPNDEKATKIVYDFYEKVEKNVLSMDILEGYLERVQENGDDDEDTVIEEETENASEYLYEEADRTSRWKGKETIRNYLKEIAGGAISLSGLLFAIYKVTGMWFSYSKKEMCIWWGFFFLLLVAGILSGIMLLIEKKKRELHTPIEWNETEFVQQSNPETEKDNSCINPDPLNVCDDETIYIERAEYHKNHSLAEVRKDREITHFIEEYPYIIGKDKERVHLHVKDRGVSHVHARLLMEQDEVYIEDLCSKNGTYINDFLIEPHEKTILHRGDILILGSSEFVFR